MYKSTKSYKMILFVMLAMLMFRPTVYAQNTEKGSIQITLSDGAAGTSKQNVVFAYARVADWVNGEYKMAEEYSGDIDFNKITTARELEETAAKMKELVKIPDGRVKTDEKGMALIKDLEEGVYLLYVVDKAEFENINPFLVAIPTWDEEQSVMDYHVEVLPKHERDVPDRPKAPKTGEESHSEKYIAAAAASMVSAIAVFYVKSRNRKKLLLK